MSCVLSWFGNWTPAQVGSIVMYCVESGYTPVYLQRQRFSVTVRQLEAGPSEEDLVFGLGGLGLDQGGYILELETKAIRRFAKVSIVSYSRPSLMIIASASQFHVYLPWGRRPFSIVS